MLDELERLLVQLYDTSAKARHVVDRVGIPAAHVELDGAMRDVWHGIIAEANRRRQLIDLVRIATEDYPNQASLQGMLRALDYAASEKALQESYRESYGEPMTNRFVRGDEGEYNPRLGERVARLEEKTESLRVTVTSEIKAINDHLEDLTAAVAARPIVSIGQARIQTAIIFIGIGIAAIVMGMLALWLRLGPVLLRLAAMS